MLTRRHFLEVAVAAAAVTGLGQRLPKAAASQAIREQDLLRFDAQGQVTLLHMADVHAQLCPIYFREPSVNLGIGSNKGLPPHLTGSAMLEAFGIPPGSLSAYMLASESFEALALAYGRVGGMDRMARLIKAISAERGDDRVLLLDGGDLLQGSYTALMSKGADMIRVAQALGVAATTGHWEFTLGQARVADLYGGIGAKGSAGIPFLAGNVVETDFEEHVFEPSRIFERGGVRIGVIGQAFPYSPIANPRWMMPTWSFGIREATLQANVARMQARGVDVIVLLSHNGFDVDRKLAGRVRGIDVILTGHTHDALPLPIKVGNTLLIASGSHGKFLSRLDLTIKDKRIADFSYTLIPVLSDAITPDPEMAALIQDIRAPHRAMLETELAVTESTLYRRGNFNGTFDDLICDAMLSQRDAEICLSPGFRWGATVLPNQPITWEHIYDATAITYPACYRAPMTGATIKNILEDVADNLFNPDPYYQQGGDMVRVGGMKFSIDPEAPIGRQISQMQLESTGAAIDASRTYMVAGWASVNQSTEGPPIWDVVASYLRDHKTVVVPRSERVKLMNG